MKILGCETAVVQVNFEGVMPGTHIVLRLITDDGREGISYVSRVNPRNMRPLRLLVEAMVQLVIGRDATDLPEICKRLYAAAPGAPVTGLELRAASAVEIAAWDLKGKALQQPVHQLLGATRTRVPVSANWGLMPGQDPGVLAAHIDRLLARGFGALKCPVGMAPLDKAIAHVQFVRRCAGPGVRIIVDGNFSWSVEQALLFAHATEDCDLYWIEDPVAPHDYAGLKHVTDAIQQNTCAGEMFQQRHEFRELLARRGADHIMIDQDLGLAGFMQVAGMAERAGCPVINHLAPEILLHAVAAAPNGLIVGLVPWAQPLFLEQLQVVAGELVLPEIPGLGLTLDAEMLERCAIE
ncbi:MAG: mandelate racemase/muconate lactonizing enzyme family protein [Pseudomonadota bacterium]